MSDSRSSMRFSLARLRPSIFEGRRKSKRFDSFETVLGDELQAIRLRRLSIYGNVSDEVRLGEAEIASKQTPLELRRLGCDAGLFGLAFSGGGIRSATFNLGVLQMLAQVGLLRHVDYLSTVSGGGYIGSWLMAWIKREGNQPAE